jgi:hypothetical protein
VTTARTVRVRRTGGFVGRPAEGSLDLSGADPAVAEARDLVASLDLTAAPAGKPRPDMYSFTFEVSLDGRVTSATVPEHLLTPALRRLAELVLGSPG